MHVTCLPIAQIKLPADIVGPGFGVRRHTMPTMPTSAKQDAAALHGINGISQIHVKSPDINHLANGIAAESVVCGRFCSMCLPRYL
jgi:hypothetical protein